MKTIHLILKNADMIEGRGPMVLTGEAFFNLDIAKNCIAQKRGVMGRSGEIPKQYPWQIKDGIWAANDHEIRPVNVLDI